MINTYIKNNDSQQNVKYNFESLTEQGFQRILFLRYLFIKKQVFVTQYSHTPPKKNICCVY